MGPLVPGVRVPEDPDGKSCRWQQLLLGGLCSEAWLQREVTPINCNNSETGTPKQSPPSVLLHWP
eukprot:15478348-Alexandrium_andersonii.AAC.1